MQRRDSTHSLGVGADIDCKSHYHLQGHFGVTSPPPSHVRLGDSFIVSQLLVCSFFISLSLRFFLNISFRGLKYVAKNRTERIQAIARFLADSDHDIVALQEIWVFVDYEHVLESVSKRLPNSKFFYRFGHVSSFSNLVLTLVSAVHLARALPSSLVSL